MRTLSTKLYVAEQVRAMDKMAIEEGGMAGIELMRRAGKEIFDLIAAYYDQQNMIVFCGAGNNAGDGYVVAALARVAGIKVDVYYLASPSELKGDAITAYHDYLQAGGVAIKFDATRVLNKAIIIDALLGTGIDRVVTGEYAQAIQCINQSELSVVAVDIPSGLNADTGHIMGYAVKADMSVTFIAHKQGMYTGEAAEHCGQIMYSSLGVDDEILQSFDCRSRHIDAVNIPKRHRCAHKGKYGHVLVVGGEQGYTGAIRLAAESALRAGAGLVSIATRSVHSELMNITCPELMCHGVDNPEQLLPLLNKATVVVIGPGLGQSDWAKALLQGVLDSGKTTICDADALNLLAQEPHYSDNWVLTPHPGEAARLLNNNTTEIALDRFSTIIALQKKYGGTVILKGAGTLIYEGHMINVSTTGNPGMATAGMGDTLAGIMAGILAQGFSTEQSTTAAVYWHGKAADLSAQKHGEIGLLASDLMPYIRTLVNE